MRTTSPSAEAVDIAERREVGRAMPRDAAVARRPRQATSPTTQPGPRRSSASCAPFTSTTSSPSFGTVSRPSASPSAARGASRARPRAPSPATPGRARARRMRRDSRRRRAPARSLRPRSPARHLARAAMPRRAPSRRWTSHVYAPEVHGDVATRHGRQHRVGGERRSGARSRGCGRACALSAYPPTVPVRRLGRRRGGQPCRVREPDRRRYAGWT